jgi:hypothetical protein
MLLAVTSLGVKLPVIAFVRRYRSKFHASITYLLRILSTFRQYASTLSVNPLGLLSHLLPWPLALCLVLFSVLPSVSSLVLLLVAPSLSVRRSAYVCLQLAARHYATRCSRAQHRSARCPSPFATWSPAGPVWLQTSGKSIHREHLLGAGYVERVCTGFTCWMLFLLLERLCILSLLDVV